MGSLFFVFKLGCRHGIGASYAGTANISVTGRPCLSWSDPSINNLMGRAAHARASGGPSFDMSLLGNHNFCRNPNASPRPWCFVGSEVTEDCDVPFCDQQLNFQNNPSNRKFFL